MSNPATQILLAEDEELNIELIKEYLDSENVSLDVATNGIDAWKLLEQNPDKYDAILLDRMMPGMDGISVLEKIKQHEQLKSTPVIIQTALSDKKSVLAGLEAGAYYYLTKPFRRPILQSILKTAIADHRRFRHLQNDLVNHSNTISLLKKAEFKYRTLEEAQNLATVIANATPKPDSVVFGLSELLINAVEHGNLDIGYEEKTRLSDPTEWKLEVSKRLQDKKYKDYFVDVSFEKSDSKIEITIHDQGKGFDWKQYFEISPERAFHTHGRGIVIARQLSFNELEYKDNGSTVIARLFLN